LAFVFNVDEEFSLAGTYAELGLAVERNLAHDFAGGCVDSCRIMATAVEGENALGCWIVENCVGVLAHIFYFVDRFQRIQIENRDRAFASIAGEAAAEIRGKRDSMDSLGIGNL